MTADPASNSQGPPGRSTLTPDYQRNWEEYYAAVAGKPPRQTLMLALDAFEREDAAGFDPTWRKAVDIACGEGRDVREMLRRAGKTRWKVMATDVTGDGLDRLCHSLAERDRDRVFVANCPMEVLPSTYPKPRFGQPERKAPSVDLINASFALPFCKPDAFPALWKWIVSTLRSGGRFAGQLFGDRDEWRPVRPESHFTRAQVLDLLKPFTIEHLDEVEKEGDDATGKPKYHHVFHIVARKT
ncbi:MAG: class I SAM-dependent methyltransferase [Phycisphaerales bacterium]|nr:class I SAM-dependent methyltransferase [Phycisphaerales bacterium]